MSTSKDTNPKDALAGDKVPFDLVPDTAIALGALAHLDGATKYGRWNWRATGVRASVYLGALKRHIAAWENGEEDAADGVPHLGHAHACLNILTDARACGVLTDDRPPAFDFSGWLAKHVTPWVGRIRERYKDWKVPHHYTIKDGPCVALDEAAKACNYMERQGWPITDPNVTVYPAPTVEPKEPSNTIEMEIKMSPEIRAAFDGLQKQMEAAIGKAQEPGSRATRVYLAGPMRGYAKCNFPHFLEAAKYLRGLGYEVVSPAEHDLGLGFDPETGDGDAQWKASAGWDFEQIVKCDAIVLLDGWKRSKGASAELAVAYHAGKKVLRVSKKNDGSGMWWAPWAITIQEPEITHHVWDAKPITK